MVNGNQYVTPEVMDTAATWLPPGLTDEQLARVLDIAGLCAQVGYEAGRQVTVRRQAMYREVREEKRG